MDLKTFLLARIEEDEAMAREEDEDYADTTLLPTYDSEHQANWNTARVLAECAAKRVVVGTYAAVKANNNAEGSVQWHEERALLTAVRALAAAYADHPDYQPEWKP